MGSRERSNYVRYKTLKLLKRRSEKGGSSSSEEGGLSTSRRLRGFTNYEKLQKDVWKNEQKYADRLEGEWDRELMKRSVSGDRSGTRAAGRSVSWTWNQAMSDVPLDTMSDAQRTW